MGTTQSAFSFRSMIRHIGPALILATVVIGPGSLTLNTIAGSLYGYQLLWVPVISTLFMLIYTWLSARITLVTGQTLFQVTRTKYGSLPATLGGVFGYLSVLAFQTGNSAAVGFAFNALFGGDVRLWTLVLSTLALGLLFLPDLYIKLEVLVKIMVGIMILTFVGTLFLVGMDTGEAVKGLVPVFPDAGSIFLILGMAATTFSIAAAVYQGYLMKEKNLGPESVASEGLDVFVGIGILGGISMVILLTSAGALFGNTDPVFSAQVMAAQLEPLAGPGAFYLFTIGFFFASFSSLVVNPLIGATLLVDGIGREARMDSSLVKRWTMVAMFTGVLIVFLFEGSPVELLRIAQGLAVVAFPILGFLVLAIARDRKLMGPYTSRTGVQVVALLGYLTLIGIVLNYIREVIRTFIS